MELSSKGKIAIAIIITAIVVGGVAGGVTYAVLSQPEKKVDALEIYHWWTSGGEAAAIAALVGVFQEEYPDVAVIQSPVSGGAGFTMLGVIKSLVLAGEAPDAFQMHAGYEGVPYYDANLLEPIDDLWTADLKNVIPDVVQSMNKFGGHYYSMPVNIHRANVVWYSAKLLEDNNIDPEKLTTWTAFFNACTVLHDDGGIAHPISMGQDWTAAHAFEQILASEGIDVYEDYINGKITSADDEDLVSALTTFKEYLGFVDTKESPDLTWDAATAAIINNESAFNIMGDWANGEFGPAVANYTYGVEYGTFAPPGTGDMYGLVIDCFQHPKNVAHPKNSDRWLEVVGSKAGQDAFNPLKGSISARTDSDLSKYGAYQKAAVADFKKVPYMFPSVVHGSGAPEAFKVKLNDIMSAFVEDKDVNKAAKAITDYIKSIIDEYTVVWSLA
ncbi:MAG: ABC transporter substrate-binding protein [Promethearchaeota archaeon]